MDNQNGENLDWNIPPSIGNTPNDLEISGIDISQSIISKLSDFSSEFPETKKQKEPKDTSYIYDYVAKYGIEEVVISNLQKLQEKELINVPFFQKLRKIFNPQMIKSKLMKGLGIRESYTGFHEFMKGDRADLPNVGICKIAKTVGYDVMIVPIPENITKLEMDRLNLYRESFLQAIENKIAELKIPITRTRNKEKDKPKEINKDFIQNLSKTENDLLKELANVPNTETDKTIGINDIFDDKQGEIQMEQKPFVRKPKVEKSEEAEISNYLNDSIDFNPDDFTDDFDDFILPTQDIDSLNIQNINSIDMGDYEDSLTNLRKIDEDDDFTFGESEDLESIK